MPRKPKQQPQPAQKNDDDFVDGLEAADEEIAAIDKKSSDDGLRSRDWRAVEKYKEERRLRQLIGDDLDFDNLLDSIERRKS